MATVDQLIARFRAATCDVAAPFLFADADVTLWLDEAQEQACIRGRLLHAADEPAMCHIQLEPGRAVYPLHSALYELTHLAHRADGGRRLELRLVSPGWLDDRVRDWRDLSGTPQYVIQNDTSLRLVPAPDEPGMLLIEGYRLAETLNDAQQSPEINRAHHVALIDWALYRAYSRPDSDTMDLERAALHERAFTAYFGDNPGSDLRRITREDLDHHNKAYI